MEKYIKYVIAVILLSGVSFLAHSVTQQEMEQARTIAAKAYLRYANDGSGYLDDLNPKTMSELESALKTKEKENIKAFKAVPVPSDYQNWDKEKLVEYWAVTAFQNKGLLEKGRGGRLRARSQINKMTIAPPAPAQTTAAPAADTKAASGNQSSTPASAASSGSPIGATAENDSTIDAEMAQLNEIPNVEEENLNVEKESNYTWVYIMVLAILVAIVVALVVYAAKVMNKNEEDHSQGHSGKDGDDLEELDHLKSHLADKDVEVAMLHKKLEAANRQNAELKAKVETLTAQLARIPEHHNVASSAPQPKEQKTSEKRSIFLGRANSKGIFVRADRTLNPGHSVFILETTDGYSGSFKVANSPSAWSLALSNPQEYLMGACTGQDLEDTSEASRIVTETSGTAVFEGGCWRVIRKARISYQ